MDDAPALLTYQQLSALTGIPRGTLSRWVVEGRLPHVRLGDRTVRFARAEIQEWLARHHVAARDWRRAGGQ